VIRARELARTPKKKRRHNGWQQKKRDAESSTRRAALAFLRWARLHGLSLAAAASLLRLRPRTLRAWEESWAAARLAPRLRGRPLQLPDRTARDLVIALFLLLGPGVSVALVRELLPELARRQIEDLQARYRSVWRKKKSTLLHVLRWKRPGAVWTMDFADAPLPVDGLYPKILAIRDLGSGKLLASLPAEHADAETVCRLLLALFLRYGPPLVLKSDNGSHFIDQIVGALLGAWLVTQLLSPPRLPAYNGSIEAGIGGLKTRAHHEAARHDRPGEWTCDDVEAARLLANSSAQPFGRSGPTPDQAWDRRIPISPEERTAFLAKLEELRLLTRQERGVLPGIDLPTHEHNAIERIAIARALHALGLLEFKRRRIPPRIPQAKWRKIS